MNSKMEDGNSKNPNLFSALLQHPHIETQSTCSSGSIQTEGRFEVKESGNLNDRYEYVCVDDPDEMSMIIDDSSFSSVSPIICNFKLNENFIKKNNYFRNLEDENGEKNEGRDVDFREIEQFSTNNPLNVKLPPTPNIMDIKQPNNEKNTGCKDAKVSPQFDINLLITGEPVNYGRKKFIETEAKLNETSNLKDDDQLNVMLEANGNQKNASIAKNIVFIDENPSQTFDFNSLIDQATGKVLEGKGFPVPLHSSTMQSSSFLLSLKSREYNRSRNLGEHAFATPSGFQKQLDRGIRRRSTGNYSKGSIFSKNVEFVNQFMDETMGSQKITERSRSSYFSALFPKSERKSTNSISIKPNSKSLSQKRDRWSSHNSDPIDSANNSIISQKFTLIMKKMESLLLSQAELHEKNGNFSDMELLENRIKLLQTLNELDMDESPSLHFLYWAFDGTHTLLDLPESITNLQKIVDICKKPLIYYGTILRIYKYFNKNPFPSIIENFLVPLSELKDLMVYHRNRENKNLFLETAAGFGYSNNILTVNGSLACLTNPSCRWAGNNETCRNFGAKLLDRLRIYAENNNFNNSKDFLSQIINNACNQIESYGACGIAVVHLNNQTGRLRVLSWGPCCVLILRRCKSTGFFNIIVNLHYTSQKFLIEEKGHHVGAQVEKWPEIDELAVVDFKSTLDTDILREAIYRRICKGILVDNQKGYLEQNIRAEEGDLVVVAEEDFLNVIDFKEFPYLFSRILTPVENKDQSTTSCCTKPLGLAELLKNIWNFRCNSPSQMTTNNVKRELSVDDLLKIKSEPKEANDPLILVGWITHLST